MAKRKTSPTGIALIQQSLSRVATLKQDIFDLAKQNFSLIKEALSKLESQLGAAMAKADDRIKISYQDLGDYEAHFYFGGDMLVFSLHSNVFNFDETHDIYKLSHLQEDHMRSYCAMINIFNFLSDSFRYSRVNDIGYQIARVFINKENHFFVEGKEHFGFPMEKLPKMTVDKTRLRTIIERVILYTIHFDLLVPPFEETSAITLEQKIQLAGKTPISTAKRLGFKFQAEQEGPR